jgi:hypothetical protein
MDQNVTDKLKSAVGSKLAGEPELRRNVVKAIEKAEQKEGETKKKHYLSFLNDAKDIVEIYKIIKNNKLSVKQKRAKIKEFLKNDEEINDFFNSILGDKPHKEENTEATSSGAAGGYETLFGAPSNSSDVDLNSNVDPSKVKTVREQTEKVEATEATSSSSTGQYNQPAIWAKSLSKKNWKGASTKYMPGAKRVQVKKKCKKFPYCNQGDIKALKIFENESVQNAIDSVSSNYKLDKEFISDIIFNEIRKRQK